MTRSPGALRLSFAPLLVSLLLGALGTAWAQPARIGVITDRTGNSADYARLIEEGIQLAVKEINKGGGMLGRQVELLWEDDEDKPQLSATKARKLADLNVPLIVQLSSSTAVQQAQAATLETKTPHFAPNQGADTLTTKLDNPYFFQSGPLGSIQGRTLMAFAGKRYKNVALVTDSSALGRIIADSFKKGIDAAGMKLVAEQIIEMGATDAVPQLQRVRAANPEAIFQAGITTAEMALFFRAYHQLGMQKVPVLGSFNLSIPKYLELVPGMLDGVHFVDVFDPEKPETKAFIAAYRSEYKRDPFSLPAYGYNAMYLVKDVVQRAGAFDREKIRQAFADTQAFNGFIGARGTTIGFSATKRAGFPEKGAVVRMIENNKHGRVVHSGL
jgi:branched-chain amino acid transport system substrate-binding protein